MGRLKGSLTICWCLLHARGGVSLCAAKDDGLSQSSPRTWRCFCTDARGRSPRRVFSTHVEVFLNVEPFFVKTESLLHARGGVSAENQFCGWCFQSSPRSWRCFSDCRCAEFLQAVFSTLVEVFPHFGSARGVWRCLLHARGGVSLLQKQCAWRALSSPRSWRCFLACGLIAISSKVFSTLVEVFLRQVHLPGLKVSLLHARGGVSEMLTAFSTPKGSSPRTWRCFLVIVALQALLRVFSTHVEVFLSA